MKILRRILIFLVLVVVVLPLLPFFELPGPPPRLPNSSDSVEIEMSGPNLEAGMIKKLIGDRPTVQRFLALFLSGTQGTDHKCASIGKFVFKTNEKTEAVFVLPGHDILKYEIRHGKKLYVISREKFISLLVEAGISENDICLDGHPDLAGVQP